MLAVVKEPRIEISLSGANQEVAELLNLIKKHYTVVVLNDNIESSLPETVNVCSDEESVNVFETTFWKDTTLGDLLQGYRLKHQLSQAQLAKMTGMTQATISGYENGKRTLSRKAAMKIFDALGEDCEKILRQMTIKNHKNS